MISCCPIFFASPSPLSHFFPHTPSSCQVPEFYHDLAENQILDIVRVNVEGTVRMTRAILPFMAKR